MRNTFGPGGQDLSAMAHNSYEMQEVKTGASKAGHIQIADESLKSVSLVTKGAYCLLMKLKNPGDDEE